MNRSLSKNLHYFQNSNPFRTLDSLSNLINDNLVLTENKNVAILNKPPGFVLLDKNKDPNGFIDIICENIKRKLNWENAFRVPIVTNDQSGISVFASNKETFLDFRKTMLNVFMSNHKAFLTFYGITAMQPFKPRGKEVFHVSYKNVENDILYFEEKKVSINQAKKNKIVTYQIEHETISKNPSLNVALVKFETSLHNGDGILVYCTKNLCPILGDHRYSSRVQNILGKPVLNLTNAVPKTQELSKEVFKSLSIEKEFAKEIPLHLHLKEINLEKSFKKQKIILKNEIPLLPYFKETLNRLKLEIPPELNDLNE